MVYESINENRLHYKLINLEMILMESGENVSFTGNTCSVTIVRVSVELYLIGVWSSKTQKDICSIC